MKTVLIYFTPLLFIFTWWTCAFLERPSNVLSQVQPVFDPPPFQSDVEPIDRQSLFRALNGDFDLMTRLMLEWDLEAQILEKKGVYGIRRLDPKVLLSLLRQEDKKDESKKKHYFPQTYLSAGILLALTDNKAITSLPKGLQKLGHIYSPKSLQNILYIADPRSLETISFGGETVAFISPYSQPCTLQVMEQRAIPMVDLGAVTTEAELKQAILTVGQQVGNLSQAKLMCAFVDAALIALDNHLATRAPFSKQVLFVNHHTTFSAPTLRTLNGNFLRRLNINKPLLDTIQNEWSIPLEIEDIAALNPDCIIFSGSTAHYTPLNVLAEIDAVKNRQLYFVDQATQETTSQHFLLGYYDLYNILMRIP